MQNLSSNNSNYRKSRKHYLLVVATAIVALISIGFMYLESLMLLTIPVKRTGIDRTPYVECNIQGEKVKMGVGLSSLFMVLNGKSSADLFNKIQKDAGNFISPKLQTSVEIGGRSVQVDVKMEDINNTELQGLLSTQYFVGVTASMHLKNDNYRLIIDLKSDKIIFDCRPWRQKLTPEDSDFVWRMSPLVFRNNVSPPVLYFDDSGIALIDLENDSDLVVTPFQFNQTNKRRLYLAATKNISTNVRVGSKTLTLYPKVGMGSNGFECFGNKIFTNNILILDFRDEIGILRR